MNKYTSRNFKKEHYLENFELLNHRKRKNVAGLRFGGTTQVTQSADIQSTEHYLEVFLARRLL